MKRLRINTAAIKAVLTGGYTHLDLREFVQQCYTLALPLVRKKIHVGKLNLSVLGLSENDVVQDIFAELFRRDEQNQFPELQRFFRESTSDIVSDPLLSIG